MNDAKAKAYGIAGAMLRQEVLKLASEQPQVGGDKALMDELLGISDALCRAAKARSESP